MIKRSFGALFALLVGTVAATAEPRDIDADARDILAPNRDTARKWVYAPHIQILYDETWKRDTALDLLSQIEVATRLTFEIETTKFNRAQGIAAMGASRYRFYRPKEGELRRSSFLQIGPEFASLQGDIFISLTSMEFATYLATLVSLDADRLVRRFAEGAIPCYFWVRSNSESLHYAYVFVSDRLPRADVEGCIYEELMQMMGLLTDSEDTPYFTFDDLADEKTRENDFDLLHALYAPHIPNDAPKDAVIEEFRRIQGRE